MEVVSPSSLTTSHNCWRSQRWPASVVRLGCQMADRLNTDSSKGEGEYPHIIHAGKGIYDGGGQNPDDLAARNDGQHLHGGRHPYHDIAVGHLRQVLGGDHAASDLPLGQRHMFLGKIGLHRQVAAQSRVVAGTHYLHLLPIEHLALEHAAPALGHVDDEIITLHPQVTLHILGKEGMHLERNTRGVCPDLAQQRRNQLGADQSDTGDGEDSLGSAWIEGARGREGRAEVFQRGRHRRIDVDGKRGGLHPHDLAIKQRITVDLPQSLEGLADGGLADLHACRRPGEAALFIDGDKDRDQVQLGTSDV